MYEEVFMNIEQQKQLSLQQVSDIYGIPLWTLRAYISKRFIPHRRIGRRIYVDRERFEKWLEARDVENIDNQEVQ